MIRWSFGLSVRKKMSPGPPDGSGVGECVGWVFGGIGGRQGAQRYRNQGCWLMYTETPALKDDLLLNVYHKYYRSAPSNGHESSIWDPGDVHGHGSARAESVRSDIFWGEPKSGCPEPNGLGPEDCDDAQGSNREEPVV